jgi:hypothetical protein
MSANSPFDVLWYYASLPKELRVEAVTSAEAEEQALREIPPAPDGMRIVTAAYHVPINPDEGEDDEETD